MFVVCGGKEKLGKNRVIAHQLEDFLGA